MSQTTERELKTALALTGVAEVCGMISHIKTDGLMSVSTLIYKVSVLRGNRIHKWFPFFLF